MKDRARAKILPRATRTSDVTRARTLALAALGAAVGAGATLAPGGTPTGSERPLARPHIVEKVKCAACHEAPLASASASPAPSPATHAASGACRACHEQNASARPAHRALAQKGQLTCASCHPAHEGAQGVTFGEAGAWVRWGAGPGAEIAGTNSVSGVEKGTTVPLVALRACAKCHDVGSVKDPIAACVSAEVRGKIASEKVGADELLRTTASSCFDEHRAYGVVPAARTVAWEGAREVASRTPWVGAGKATGSPWLPLGGAFAGAGVVGAFAALVERRRRSVSVPQTPKLVAPAARKKLPVIDPGSCLGCYACVDACPFDVLAIEKYVAVVARPEECCGVVLCEQVCPNGSLSIVEGEPVLDQPMVDEHLESKDVPGLFLAGDLTGLPLIKNAINQGVRAIDRIATTMPKRRSGVDVVIVGAGPAGLSAALRAQEKGLSCVVLEQATVASSVKSFPRDKLVYDPPLDLPVEGELWLREASKDELLAQWTRIVRARRIDVREGRRVTAIEREGDGFVVSTSSRDGEAAHESMRATRIVLAIGRRGTPRKLDLTIDPGAEHQVSYALADARSFAGKRVVVAGLGDAAMEAAVALARQPDTSVTIAYRGSTFTRGKSRNIEEVQQLVAKGRLRILFETVPVAVTRTTITLSGATPGKARRTLQADALLVLIGGLPSWDLLARCGIRRPESPENRERGTGNRE